MPTSPRTAAATSGSGTPSPSGGRGRRGRRRLWTGAPRAGGRRGHPLRGTRGIFFPPPTQYLGYVGFTIPFAFAIAAMATKRLDDEWIRATRRWTLASWFFLTLGVLFGMQWAYVELGWGGY